MDDYSVNQRKIMFGIVKTIPKDTPLICEIGLKLINCNDKYYPSHMYRTYLEDLDITYNFQPIDACYVEMNNILSFFQDYVPISYDIKDKEIVKKQLIDFIKISYIKYKISEDIQYDVVKSLFQFISKNIWILNYSDDIKTLIDSKLIKLWLSSNENEKLLSYEYQWILHYDKIQIYLLLRRIQYFGEFDEN